MQRQLLLLSKFLSNYKLVILIYWLVAIVLLTLPGNKFPERSWFKTLQIDKWIHIGLFFGLTFFTLSFNLRFSKKTLLILTTFCFAFGIAIEFIQEHYIINRSFDKWDIVADGIGVIVGYLFLINIKNKR